MRAIVLAGLGAAAVATVALFLSACDQDYAASNADRHSFMGSVRAYEPSLAPSSEAAPSAAAPTPAAPPPAAAPASAAASGEPPSRQGAKK
jgi:hypothetical protein